MFDCSFVKSLGQSIISLDGDRVFTEKLVEDENEKQNAKICSLIFEEAVSEYVFNRPKIAGRFATLDEIIDKFIEFYDLNLNGTKRAQVIDEILASDGHFEKHLKVQSLSKTNYRILGRTEKGRVLALLNLHSRNRGFSIEDLNFSYDFDTKQNDWVLLVSFKKILLTKKQTSSIFDLDVADRITYAQNQLSLVQENGDELMAKYWNDVISNVSKKVNVLSTESHREKSKKRQPREHTETKTTSYKTSFSQYKYANDQLEKAKISKDADLVEFWGDVIESIKNTSFLYVHEDELQNFYRSRTSALKNGNLDMAKQWELSIKRLLEENPISISNELWTSIDRENRKHFITLKMMEADVVGTKEEQDYWASSLKLMEENYSQFEDNYQEI